MKKDGMSQRESWTYHHPWRIVLTLGVLAFDVWLLYVVIT